MRSAVNFATIFKDFPSNINVAIKRYDENGTAVGKGTIPNTVLQAIANIAEPPVVFSEFF